MGKVARNGKAHVLLEKETNLIRKAFEFPRDRLLFDIARFTGERWGALVQLEVEDCYADAGRALPGDLITFKAQTRKASPDGHRRTRQVPVSSGLKEALLAYRPPVDGYLFPGRVPGTHLSFDAADRALRLAVARAGLTSRGISTHSTRRTFITRLADAGIGLDVLQNLTGHASVQVLAGYIQSNPGRLRIAVESA